jgi:hypothetical protein
MMPFGTFDELHWILFTWAYAAIFAGMITLGAGAIFGFIEWVDGEGPLFDTPPGFWQMGRWLGFSCFSLGTAVLMTVF